MPTHVPTKVHASRPHIYGLSTPEFHRLCRMIGLKADSLQTAADTQHTTWNSGYSP